MTLLDKRFALLRGNETWDADAIVENQTNTPMFRISRPVESRDAHSLSITGVAGYRRDTATAETLGGSAAGGLR